MNFRSHGNLFPWWKISIPKYSASLFTFHIYSNLSPLSTHPSSSPSLRLSPCCMKQYFSAPRSQLPMPGGPKSFATHSPSHRNSTKHCTSKCRWRHWLIVRRDNGVNHPKGNTAIFPMNCTLINPFPRKKLCYFVESSLFL